MFVEDLKSVRIMLQLVQKTRFFGKIKVAYNAHEKYFKKEIKISILSF
jgi:hypothetical protein